MGFFSRFRKVDSATRIAQDEQAKREAKQSAKNRRQSRVDLNHWESKYGRDAGADSAATGVSSSSDERTVVHFEPTQMEKSRSRGSVSTFQSYKPESVNNAPGRISIDFLPRIELSYGEPTAYSSPTVTSIVPSPSPSPRLSRESTSFDGGRRPPLAVIQSSDPAARSVSPSKRDSYLSERQFQIASPQPRRQSRAISMRSLAVPPPGRGTAASPRLQDLMDDPAVVGDGADDDDIPLAAVRSRSSPVLPQRSSMYALAPPSPGLGGPAASSSTPSLTMPTSRSRASLSIPSVLLPPSPSLEALSTPRSLPRQDTQRSLAAIGKTGTLIDLTAPSSFDPYYERNRRAQAGATAERIAVGERRKASPASGFKPTSGPANASAHIMEFGELEARHKKRISTLQGTANEKVEAEKALALYQEKQRKEAESQRRREARRSVASNLDQLAKGSKANRPDESTKQRSRMSVSNLSLLLKRGAAPEAKVAQIPNPLIARDGDDDDDVPLQRLARSPSGTALPGQVRPRPRRSSTQGLTASQSRKSIAGGAGGPPRPSLGTRRHSLGTLLEVSHDQADIQADLLDLHSRGSPSPEVEKIAEWRRRSSVQLSELADSPVRSPTPQRAQRRQSNVAFGEAIVLQNAAAATPTQPKKKAHDWLSY